LNKFILPDSGSEIAARVKADLEANTANLNASLKSLFESKMPAKPQPVGPHASVGSALPRHRLGAFRERLRATLHIDPSSQ
jgi:hypothetical protein